MSARPSPLKSVVVTSVGTLEVEDGRTMGLPNVPSPLLGRIWTAPLGAVVAEEKAMVASTRSSLPVSRTPASVAPVT